MNYTLKLDFYGNTQEIKIEITNAKIKEMICNNCIDYYLNNNHIKSISLIDANDNTILQMTRE